MTLPSVSLNRARNRLVIGFYFLFLLCVVDYAVGEPPTQEQLAKWKEEAEKGDVKAQCELGYFYYVGDGARDRDPLQAIKWYARAAKAGSADAQFHQGVAYSSGDGVSLSVPEAVKWYRKAADQGHVYSQWNLGKIYATGEGVETDLKEAVKWLSLAAEKGNAQLKLWLAGYYESGRELPRDEKQAWFERAAQAEKNGHGLSFQEYLTLGRKYYNGDGLPKNFAQAFKWSRRAAKEGDSEAQFLLGTMYAKGDGVERDSGEAERWFIKSCEKNPDHEASLGLIYQRGDFLRKDARQAIRWFRQAADRGDFLGQYFLGASYFLGEGVPKNFVESYKWLNLAAGQGHEGVAQMFGGREPKQYLNFLESVMTREQIAEGQRLSAGFAPRDPMRADGEQSDSRNKEEQVKRTGTGFFVTADGYLLTCFHVVRAAKAVEITSPTGGLVPAWIVTVDKLNDIAVLKANVSSPSLPVVSSQTVELGESVFTIGFPNVPVQGVEPKLTRGEINSLAGVADDPRQFQISLPIQPGNSGGPLVDQWGNVIAIVSGRLDDMKALEITGLIPQNVNYAMKTSYAMALFRSVPELTAKLKQPNPARRRNFETVVTEVKSATVMVVVR